MLNGTTTKQQINNSEDRKYGLASLIAMIVGIVIGAGSFVKNQGIMDTTGSAAAGYIG